MSASDETANADQAEYWNSAAGRKWVAHDEILGTILRGVDARLLARADPRPGERAIEVGCGTGATTRALAARIGEGGRVLAVDISEPMLARARERAAGLGHVTFLRADAQVHRFEPSGADLVISRFGMMFFDDPAAAFRNIAGALRPGGRTYFVAWAPLDENPWFAIPREAAIARLGSPEPQPPTAPGPLAFADRDRVRRLMAEAGHGAVEGEAEDIDLAWPCDLQTLVDLATSVGPAARILRERGGGPDDEAAIRDSIAVRLAAFAGPDGCRIPARLNFFSSQRG